METEAQGSAACGEEEESASLKQATWALLGLPMMKGVSMETVLVEPPQFLRLAHGD